MSASPAGSGDEKGNNLREEAIAILEDSSNETVIRAVEGFISGNAAKKIAEERVDAEKRHKENDRRKLDKHSMENETPLISEIRGYVFEQIALKMLSEGGEPLNRELSDLLVDICRRPGYFLNKCVKTELESELLEAKTQGERVEISNKLRQISILDEGLSSFPRNNDAIAVQSRMEDGKATVEIVAAYEMKNCKIPQAQKANEIVEQLKESKTRTVAMLAELIPYLPEYYRFYKRHTGVDSGLPLVSGVVDISEFKQIVVQPDFFGEAKKDQKAEYIEEMKTYTNDVRFLEVRWDTVDRIAQALVLDVETEIRKIKYPNPRG